MASGDAIRYRSIGGVLYDGQLLEIIDETSARIAVDIGAKDPVTLNMVRWRGNDDGQRYTAWPKGH